MVKNTFPAIAGVKIQAIKFKRSTLDEDPELDLDQLCFNRKNTLVSMLKQNLNDIKNNYNKLCQLIRQYHRHHKYINCFSYGTYELILQQRMSYLLLNKITEVREKLGIDVKNFCLDSERDTGQEKYPLHFHNDICKIIDYLKSGGVAEIHINNIKSKFKNQLEQTLRIIKCELLSLAESDHSCEQYILKNINNPLIKNYIIKRGNGIDEEYNTGLFIITHIISYYNNFITT